MENSSPDSARTQKTRLLRMLILSLGGIGVLFVLGRSCGPENAEGTSPKSGTRSPAPVGEKAGGASLGFDELTIGQEYKASVASQSHRVTTLEQDVSGLKRDLGALRA